MGSEADLRALVDSAYRCGIRILFGAVMSHTGCATLVDMQEYQFGALYLSGDELRKTLDERWSDWKPAAGQTWCSSNDHINFSDRIGQDKWQGKNWTRTDIGDYDNPRFDDLATSLAFLLDIETESTSASGPPIFYKNKTGTHTKDIGGFTPRDYLAHWLSQWIHNYGIDDFWVDTAKHVESSAWQQLGTEVSAALCEQKRTNPDKALDDEPFWVTGEVWSHGVMQSDYYCHSFDAMINLGYQEQATKAVDCLAQMGTTWQ